MTTLTVDTLNIETTEQRKERNTMSAITVVFDMPSVTAAQYEQVIRGLEVAGAGNPEGRLYHVASAKEGGWLVVDVWESGELLNQFAQTLAPIMHTAGVTPPQLQVYPVHKIIEG
jgi:hypothetical protein